MNEGPVFCEQCLEILPPIINRRGRNLCLSCIVKDIDRELEARLYDVNHLWNKVGGRDY